MSLKVHFYVSIKHSKIFLKLEGYILTYLREIYYLKTSGSLKKIFLLHFFKFILNIDLMALGFQCVCEAYSTFTHKNFEMIC